MIAPLFLSLRPRQWTKNLVLFAPLVFSEKHLLTNPLGWAAALAGFIIFCGLSGSVYLLNDLVDREKDRLHPEKCQRPIASGNLPIREAKGALVVLLLTCLIAAWFVSPRFFLTATMYFTLNVGYSFWLKRVVILDVLCIAIGFVLRAQAGVNALDLLGTPIAMSHWLLLATLMLATYLGLAKRRQEIARLQDGATSHRKILAHYSTHFIDQMLALVGATTLITYVFYTVDAETVRKFGTDKLLYTIPNVLYGLMRYLYLIHIEHQGDNPSEILLTDVPMIVNLLIWIMLVIGIIHLPAMMS